VNCRQALAHARQTLEDSGIENSSLEGEILVRFVLGLDRASLFSNPDLVIAPDQIENLSALLQRRLLGEPSAYITGHKEFFGLNFKVDPRVLIPRPETELLVEKAVEFYKTNNYTSIADIGTGSGCIAISLAKALRDARIYAIDCSASSLQGAKENAVAHGITNQIHFLLGNLLQPLAQPVDMVVANLPYVKKDELNLKFEPALALDGGPDGLDIIRELITLVHGRLKPQGALLLEVGQGQAYEVKTNLHKVFPKAQVKIFRDLAGIDRVVTMRLTS
jgi:release factor glutamine methyltransferase